MSRTNVIQHYPIRKRARQEFAVVYATPVALYGYLRRR